MVTTVIDNRSVYLTSGKVTNDNIETTGTQKVIKIGIESFQGNIRRNFTKGLVDIDSYNLDPEGEGGVGYDDRKVKELTFRRTINVTGGRITEESGTTAISKVKDFYTLMGFGVSMILVWGKAADSEQFKETGFPISAEVTERVTGSVHETGSTSGASTIQRNFSVNFSFLIAVDA